MPLCFATQKTCRHVAIPPPPTGNGSAPTGNPVWAEVCKWSCPSKLEQEEPTILVAPEVQRHVVQRLLRDGELAAPGLYTVRSTTNNLATMKLFRMFVRHLQEHQGKPWTPPPGFTGSPFFPTRPSGGGGCGCG